ncbi:ROK family protein [Curtobacterium pusillum]|uniref:ROK family protein n=1 Tax=Curtobacterium pusillum TaxID=69373 RepID=A0ABX2MHU9_9MICO|nr:ROK family protein [Curtobacterium pusillum]NUU15491.1 ROK family protein [Curtobacterium pusillum]GLK32790.1 sugar kinase [Curtobacterium pusillum]
MAVVAVDIGGTTVKGALFDVDGTVLDRATVATFPTGMSAVADGPGGPALAAVTALVTQLAASATASGRTLTGIGLCSPGLVDAERGRVVVAVNLGWTDLPIAELLAARFDVPVALEHDARAAARAERAARLAADKPVDEFVFIPIGTGVSATVVTGGTIVHGATGGAGEFGHVPVVPDGEVCTCGQRGCVEVYASAGNVLRRYREAGGALAGSTRELVDLVGTDPIAARVWQEAVEALATGVVMLTAVLDPGAVIIGGGLGEAGDRLLVPLRAAVAERMRWRALPNIEQSLVGAGAGLAGAAILVNTQSTSTP